MFEGLKDTTKQFILLNKFKELNSVQKVSLDNYKSKKDIFIISKTGTGKTHAYLIPICETINTISNKTQVLISSPTRELAYQIYKNASVLKQVFSDIRISLISGGFENSFNSDLKPHIIIGTPGKLKLLFDNSLLMLDSIQLLVIDEADMTLEYGFLEDLDYIFSKLIKHSKVMCFSATLKDECKKFVISYLNNPVIINVNDKKKDPKNKYYLINSKHLNYNECLLKLLPLINPFVCLIFTNSKDEADTTYKVLINHNYKVLLLHGGLDAHDRRKALKDLSSNKYSYIVCSDVASRGIDIEACSHVISLGIPKKTEFFIHRAGRTGRNGRDGYVYAICNDSDIKYINTLKKEGINFVQKTFKNGKLIDIKKRKYITNNFEETEKEIKKIINKKNDKVKPNYKKKKKIAIEKIKRKAKREFIKKKIKEQRKDRYKAMSKNKYENRY